MFPKPAKTTLWSGIYCIIRLFWSACNASYLHIVNNILNWSRCRIHIDEICAVIEFLSLSIDEAILVGSGPYDTLDALKRAS